MTRVWATSQASWWRRLGRIARLERGVFAEIAADPGATWQALGVLVTASLIGGWRFLWPGDGEWHVRQWLLEEAGVAVAGALAGAALLWTIARLAGGSGTVLGLWRGMAFTLIPIALGAVGFIGVWVGAALAIPLLVRAVAETQTVRTLTAIVAVSAPVVLYAGFVLFVIVVLGWD